MANPETIADALLKPLMPVIDKALDQAESLGKKTAKKVSLVAYSIIAPGTMNNIRGNFTMVAGSIQTPNLWAKKLSVAASHKEAKPRLKKKLMEFIQVNGNIKNLIGIQLIFAFQDNSNEYCRVYSCLPNKKVFAYNVDRPRDELVFVLQNNNLSCGYR